MKNFIRISLVALAIICCGSAANAQFRWGVAAGGTLTNLHFKQDLVTVKQQFGGQAGVVAELMFPGVGFGIDFGLIYNLGGAKVNLGEKPIWASQGYGNERIMLHQLIIPLHLRFKWTRMNGLEEYVAPFVFAGPDLTILAGHSNCKAMKWAGGDVGLTGGVGFELCKRWQISGSYSWGMTYILKTALLTNYSAQTRQWTVRLADFF